MTTKFQQMLGQLEQMADQEDGACIEAPEMLSAGIPPVPAERIPFHSAAQEAEGSDDQVARRVNPWIADGSVTEVAGKIKTAGKTTFMLEISRCVATGQPFLGKATAKAPVVYLTEQPRSSFRQALRRAGLLGCADFHFLYWRDVFGVSWPEVAEAAVQKAISLGALLIVDTLPQFAGIRGDGENSADEALYVMGPLQVAAADGIPVVVIRHERKNGGDVGDSGRGSSAFGGAVDTLVTITRGDGNTAPNVRVIHAVSRYDDVPAELYIELTDDGYVVLGSGSDVAHRKARDYLLDNAPGTEEKAAIINDLRNGGGFGRTVAQKAINELVTDRLLNWVGSGKKGDPFRFWRPEKLSAAFKDEEAAERKHAPKRSSGADPEPAMEKVSAGTSTLYSGGKNPEDADVLELE